MLLSLVLVISVGIASSITLNPIILGCVSGSGFLLKTFSEAKNYKRKIEMSKFAHTNYDKVLADIRSYLRGLKYNNKDFINYPKILYEATIDLSPLPDKFEKKYNKLFVQ